MHLLPSLQPGRAPTQEPLWHVPPVVQPLPSTQPPPSPIMEVTQTPDVGMQVDEMQGDPLVQVTSLPSGTQALPWQMRLPLHRSPSSTIAQSLSVLHWQELTPGVQPPGPQTSPKVQESPSSQGIPALTSHGKCAQPLTGSQASLVQTTPSSQLVVSPGKHTPLLHNSPIVQALPSSHAIPVPGTALSLHRPVAGAQVLVTHEEIDTGHRTIVLTSTTHLCPLHISLPLQMLSSSILAQSLVSSHSHAPFSPMQAPSKQTSLLVQSLPSSHAKAALSGKCLQPGPAEVVVSTHKSTVQGFKSSQSWIMPPTQMPLAHNPPLRHGSPPRQGLLSGIVVWKQRPWMPLSHKSPVHGSPSLQVGVPPMHALPRQLSPLVHASPSSQVLAVEFAVWTQPLPIWQASLVHALLSSQLVLVPPLQVPLPSQVAPVRQLRSPHATPVGALCVTQPLAVQMLSAQSGTPNSLHGRALAGSTVHTPATQAAAPMHAGTLGQSLASTHAHTGLPTQAPPWQWSLSEQALPSSQLLVLSVPPLQPNSGSHTLAQGPPSPHVTLVVLLQTPLTQVSSSVQTLPSLQVPPSFVAL